ncbi:GGDEF domain-containing protein [Sporomusa acidovorans]|uniref:GGDEF domain-containing protein n=1 Tax=Sporomusa acidovorans (strain ATCC 49682 / DSM 3132 / Mol) TaxID=1123286 RepID=A0ABZ3IWG6_SPOA4|nr:diguanylate cyclase [Sporomusa acidovorans]OZC23877.1 putative diguanylate cyclase YcdT [Sporomusa acidovorans DSM 3132]SDF54789.1 5TMR of 5TMR-LYT [Sporomusa acidovorans]
MIIFKDISLLPIIYELLQNLALLYTIISLFMPVILSNQLRHNYFKFYPKGILFFSLLALISMLVPIQFNQIPDVTVDLRIATIILTSAYLGPFNAFLVGAMTGIFRVMLGGLGWIAWLPAALICGPLSFFIIKQVRSHTTGMVMATITCTLVSMTIFAINTHYFHAFLYLSPLDHPNNFYNILVALVTCNTLAAVAYDRAINNIIKHQKDYDALRLKADVDGMTGLFNHNKFQYELAKALDSAKKSRKMLCLLMLDLDYFKKYNDNFGHQAGDALLQEVSRFFLESIRPQDIASRYGGEEFAIVLPDCSEYEALQIAEKIRRKIEQHQFYGCEEMPKGKVTISIGIACYPTNSADKESLIQKADSALYAAKRSGRNKSLVYSPYGNVCFMVKP